MSILNIEKAIRNAVHCDETIVERTRSTVMRYGSVKPRYASATTLFNYEKGYDVTHCSGVKVSIVVLSNILNKLFDKQVLLAKDGASLHHNEILAMIASNLGPSMELFYKHSEKNGVDHVTIMVHCAPRKEWLKIYIDGMALCYHSKKERSLTEKAKAFESLFY